VGLLPFLFRLFAASQVTLHESDRRLALDPFAYAGRCRVHCGARRPAATASSSCTTRDRALGLVMLGALQDRLHDKAAHWRIPTRPLLASRSFSSSSRPAGHDVDRTRRESQSSPRNPASPAHAIASTASALCAVTAGKARAPTLHLQVRLFSARRSVKRPNGLRCIVGSLHGGEWRDEEMGSCCVHSGAPRGLVRGVRSEFVAVWQSVQTWNRNPVQGPRQHDVVVGGMLLVLRVADPWMACDDKQRTGRLQRRSRCAGAGGGVGGHVDPGGHHRQGGCGWTVRALRGHVRRDSVPVLHPL